jgi:hypothetical protein
LRSHFAAAKRARHRRNWPAGLLVDILGNIASTSMSVRQIIEAHGGSYKPFIALTERDLALEKLYLQAKERQALFAHEDLAAHTEEAIAAAPKEDKRALRSVVREYNRARHRLESLSPVRLRNRERLLTDPRGANLSARRRRAAAHARRDHLSPASSIPSYSSGRGQRVR